MYEQMPFDIATYHEGRFYRVQVKYRALVQGGVSVVFRSSSRYTSGKPYAKAWDKSEVDVLAIYCPDNDTCYYLDPKAFKGSVILRVEESLNRQQRGVHRAADFTDFPLGGVQDAPPTCRGDEERDHSSTGRAPDS